jgi:LysM repeat protein
VIGVVRFGDTLSKIADRYGITLAELLRLNPGLDIARLVVGSQVRLAAPLAPVRTTALSLISTGSGVLRWPDISIPATSQRNTTQLPSASEPIQKPLSQREQALLEQIRSQPSGQWRTYGECHYDWSQWKLYANGIRSTNVDCGHEKLIIGVSCTKLLVARYDPQSGWSNWRSPASGDRVNKGQDEMTAALCANIKP